MSLYLEKNIALHMLHLTKYRIQVWLRFYLNLLTKIQRCVLIIPQWNDNKYIFPTNMFIFSRWCGILHLKKCFEHSLKSHLGGHTDFVFLLRMSNFADEFYSSRYQARIIKGPDFLNSQQWNPNSDVNQDPINTELAPNHGRRNILGKL